MTDFEKAAAFLDGLAEEAVLHRQSIVQKWEQDPNPGRRKAHQRHVAMKHAEKRIDGYRRSAEALRKAIKEPSQALKEETRPAGWQAERATFAKGYCDRSGIKEENRTETGFKFGDRESVAVPCTCGEDGCEGWAMVSSESAIYALWRAGFAPRWAVDAEIDRMAEALKEE